MEKSCAFTGHRPQAFLFGMDEEHPLCQMLKKVLRREIRDLIQNGYAVFYTGCACGVDMWAGEIVAEEKKKNPWIQLYGVIPFQGQARTWPENLRMRYRELLNQTTENVVLQSAFTRDCFFRRNRYMVEHADLVMAVYDRKQKKSSGTGYTVRYAEKKKVPVRWINPTTLCVIDEFGNQRTVKEASCHISAGKQGPGGENPVNCK